MNDVKNTAFFYGVNMLRKLLKMELITEEEYKRIVENTKGILRGNNYIIT